MISTLSAVCLIFLAVMYTPLVSDDKGIRFTVQSGKSLKSVINELSAQHVIKHPRLLSLLIYFKGGQHDLKAGEYLFPKGTTSSSLLRQITTGSGMLYHTFTIIAGWNFNRLRDALLHEENFQHITNGMSNDAIMKRLGHPGLNPEGEFFPDTYFFVKGSSDMAILKRAFQMMQKKLMDAWQLREPGLPFKTPVDALIAASLIEKETGLDKERPTIAGVIINRLKKNMLLQIDPTVIYAKGSDFNGTIYRVDLSSKNPYNTYTHKGLPPTPIAIPGMASINAALHPEHHHYYYFVAKKSLSTVNGGHQFSETLAEHDEAIDKAKNSILHIDFFNMGLIQHYFLTQLGNL